MDAVQVANTAFAVDVFKKLAEKDKTANIIFAPLCTSTSLALAYKAAKGDTASQMKQGLHLEDVKDIPFGFQTLTTDTSKLSTFYPLKMVKRLYVEKSLNPTTTETKPVQMMNLEATFCLGYINDLKIKVLELPCHNKHMSMLILLPKEIEDDTTGLEQLEKALSPEKLLEWTNPSVMANTKVNVFLPKFKVEAEYDFKPILESLGMTNMFNKDASDFSEMSETKEVVMSQVIHKVSLEVVEDGADSRDVPGYRILQHKDECKVDHPFIFLFRHNKTRSIILAGRFCSP
ncbi:hypothetical protein lerEdw1_006657 [Lerista edwardsae]|nr:hypothetical protein lerEdw1_006657 [Lerista edwardsae]